MGHNWMATNFSEKAQCEIFADRPFDLKKCVAVLIDPHGSGERLRIGRKESWFGNQSLEVHSDRKRVRDREAIMLENGHFPEWADLQKLRSRIAHRDVGNGFELESLFIHENATSFHPG